DSAATRFIESYAYWIDRHVYRRAETNQLGRDILVSVGVVDCLPAALQAQEATFSEEVDSLRRLIGNDAKERKDAIAAMSRATGRRSIPTQSAIYASVDVAA